MGRALVLNTYSKAAITGGAFEALTANTGDSLAIPSFTGGRAELIEAWGIDSDSVAEFGIRSTRFHDNVRGLRFACAALTPGGAATVGQKFFLPEFVQAPLYSSDTLIVEVNATAADDAVISTLSYYENLDGIDANLHSWQEIKPRIVNYVGIQVKPVASATVGAYGADRALNADDDRLKADKWYALLGATSTLVSTTLSIKGPNTGQQRIGIPLGTDEELSVGWFIMISERNQLPLIPVIAANNRATTILNLADGEASTAPTIDLLFAELS